MANFTKAYKADKIESLRILELNCENDEFNLTARMINLELAKVGDVKVTAVTYTDDEVDDNTNLGELILIKYTDEDDKLRQKDKNTNNPLFEGEAYVNSNPVKLLVFRENTTA